MQQIADELNLNRATVSMVINGHARSRGISEQTSKRVTEYLKKVGFVASRNAIGMRSGKRSGVGILYNGHLYSHLLQAFNRLTLQFSGQSQGFEVVIRSSSEILDGLREIVSRGVERLIWIHGGGMVSIPDSTRQEAIALARKLKAVIYNYKFDLAQTDQELIENGLSLIGVSRKAGFLQMAQFLQSQGHCKVLLADVEKNTQDVLDGQFISAIKSRGIEPSTIQQQLTVTSNLISRGRSIGKRILQSMDQLEFSALCFRDDEIAIGAIAELMKNGIRVPKDFSVISMDGHPLSEVFQVPLTTLAIPVDSMVDKTIQLIRNQDQPGIFRFNYKLLKRSSH